MRLLIPLVFLVGLSLPTPIIGQATIKVIYREKYIFNLYSTIKALKVADEESRANIAKISHLVKNVTDTIFHFFTLTIADGKSLFEYDSTVGKSIHHSPDYYKDHTNKRLIEDWFDMEDSQGEGPLITADKWETYYSDTIRIGDYLCFYANMKRAPNLQIDAWFTTDIPVSEGPFSYTGLPGLILNLVERDSKSGAILKEVKAMKVMVLNEKINITLPDKPNKMSIKDYREEKKRRMGF